MATIDLYDRLQTTAFPGMKADSMNDNVESWACGQFPIQFGVVCGFTPTWTNQNRLNSVFPGENIYYAGITLHDHLVGSRGVYVEGDTVNVLTRGRVWAKVHENANADDIINHGPAFFHPSTGEIMDRRISNPSLHNATIRTRVVTVPPMLEIAPGPPIRVVLVELHYPFFTNVAVRS
jgi:hypothetical protein